VMTGKTYDLKTNFVVPKETTLILELK